MLLPKYTLLQQDYKVADMTKTETERLVKVETKLDYIQEDIAEIKAMLQAMAE